MIAWFVQFCIVAVMYHAFLLKIEGAQNLVLFYAWMASALFVVGSFGDVDELAKAPKKPLGEALKVFGVANSVALLALFAWHHQFITATVWFVGLSAVLSTASKIEKIRAAK